MSTFERLWEQARDRVKSISLDRAPAKELADQVIKYLDDTRRYPLRFDTSWSEIETHLALAKAYLAGALVVGYGTARTRRIVIDLQEALKPLMGHVSTVVEGGAHLDQEAEQ